MRNKVPVIDQSDCEIPFCCSSAVVMPLCNHCMYWELSCLVTVGGIENCLLWSLCVSLRVALYMYGHCGCH